MQWKMTIFEFCILVIISYSIHWFVVFYFFDSNPIIYFIGWIPLTLFLNLHNWLSYKYINIVFKKGYD